VALATIRGDILMHRIPVLELAATDHGDSLTLKNTKLAALDDKSRFYFT
jgi:hypothetical protein